MPRITYTKGRTINLGNFESLRVDIGIEIDCESGKEDETFTILKTWVEGRLKQEKVNG